MNFASLAVEAGECVGIAGPSGSGKLTLLKLLAGLVTPTESQVLIDRVPMSSLGLAAYRDRVGCVLQDDRLFAGSIAETLPPSIRPRIRPGSLSARKWRQCMTRS